MCEEHKEEQSLTAEQGAQSEATEVEVVTEATETPTEQKPAEPAPEKPAKPVKSFGDIPDGTGTTGFVPMLKVGMMFRRKTADEKAVVLVDSKDHLDGLLVATPVTTGPVKNPKWYSADLEFDGTFLVDKDGKKVWKPCRLHTTRKFHFVTKCCGPFVLSERMVNAAAEDMGVADDKKAFKNAKALAHKGVCPICHKAGPVKYEEKTPLEVCLGGITPEKGETGIDSQRADLISMTHQLMDRTMSAEGELTIPMLVGFVKSDDPGIDPGLPAGVREILTTIPAGCEATQTVEEKVKALGLRVVDFNTPDVFFERVNFTAPEIVTGVVKAEDLGKGIKISGERFSVNIRLDISSDIDRKAEKPQKAEIPKVF